MDAKVKQDHRLNTLIAQKSAYEAVAKAKTTDERISGFLYYVETFIADLRKRNKTRSFITKNKKPWRFKQGDTPKEYDLNYAQVNKDLQDDETFVYSIELDKKHKLIVITQIENAYPQEIREHLKKEATALKLFSSKSKLPLLLLLVLALMMIPIPESITGSAFAEGSLPLSITSPIEGQILILDESGSAKEGEMIAQVQQPQLTAQIVQAEHNVKLYRERIIASGSQGEENIVTLQTEYEIAQAELASLKDKQAQADITAPYSGVYTWRTELNSSYVNAGDPLGIFEQAHQTSLAVYIPIDEWISLAPSTPGVFVNNQSLIRVSGKLTQPPHQIINKNNKLVYRAIFELDKDNSVLLGSSGIVKFKGSVKPFLYIIFKKQIQHIWAWLQLI